MHPGKFATNKCNFKRHIRELQRRTKTDSSYAIKLSISQCRLSNPESKPMALPPELIGMIVDNVLPEYKPWDSASSGVSPSYIALAHVSVFFRNEVDAAIQRTNAWLRNLCFDENGEGDRTIMSYLDRLEARLAWQASTRIRIDNGEVFLAYLNSWFDPGIDAIVEMFYILHKLPVSYTQDFPCSTLCELTWVDSHSSISTSFIGARLHLSGPLSSCLGTSSSMRSTQGKTFPW